MATISSFGNSISFSGLASGIDTKAIIDGITALNTKRIQTLQTQKNEIVARKTAFSDLRSKLTDLQTQSGRLARSVAGAFDARNAVSSDGEAVTATASSIASPGQFSIVVENLAKANQIASEGFADTGTNIKTGTLTLRVGSGTATTVTIDSTNNTLQGLADAINSAGGDTRAAIINDGTATPYRLLVTSSRTGAANAIQVTNNLTGGTGAGINPTDTTVRAAEDAAIRLGAITVTSATNRIDKLVAGITLDLNKADPAKSITITVSPDSAGATDAMADFVASFNAVVDYIDQRDDYNQETLQAGILLGSSEAASLRRDLTLVLTESVPGINLKANRLSAIGLKLTDKGKLEFDQSKFTDVFAGNVPGVGPGDIKRLFALTGSSTSPGAKFLLGGSKTLPSGSTPYQVDVTQAATRAAATATNMAAGSTVITSSNNVFSVRIDSRQSAALTIAEGTYTPAQLAAAIQSAINADTALNGSQVVVDLESGKLRITSQRYGGDSQVSIGTGTAVSSGILGFTGSEVGTGQNVAGRYLVNSVVETATGIGQVLSGTSGNANTDGLQVLVTLSPGQVVSGPDADLTVTRGLAERLNLVLNKYLDTANGRLKSVDKQFTAQADVYDSSIKRQNDILEEKTASLLRQFAAMESAVSRLNSLSLQLSAQFLAPASNNSSNRRT